MIDSHRQAFIEEATELLSALETSLLELENSPTDNELIAKIFRALHTIKGSSAMFGYDDISMFTHDIENAYDFIRNGELEVTKDLIDLTLAARDQIMLMLFPGGDSKLDENLTRNILESFSGIVKNHHSKKVSPAAPIPIKQNKIVEEKAAVTKCFLISFQPGHSIFQTGTNPIALLREINSLGSSIVVSKLDQIPSLEKIDPEQCYANWEIVLRTNQSVDAIKDVFIFVEDQCEISIKEIDQDGKLNREEDFQDFKNLLNEIAKTKHPQITSLLLEFESSNSPISLNQLAAAEIKKVKKNSESQQEADSSSSIRVSAEKLDELVNLVGELVTIQARLNQIATSNQDQNVIMVAEEVGKNNMVFT